MAKAKKGFFRKLFRILFLSILWFFGITISMVVIYRFVPPPVSMVMLSKWITGDAPGIEKDWVSYEEINPNAAIAFIASEDQNFPFHSGFDMEAIEKAIKNNKKGKKIRGASTISQQTAKNVFLTTDRTWVRKGLEVYFTFLIEMIWPKERILEVYMNVVELGPGLYGVEAASQKYFKHSAAKLTVQEAALLAVALPNPIKYKVAKPGPYMLKRRSWVVNQVYGLGGKSYLKNLE